jgi:hypothetical protein
MPYNGYYDKLFIDAYRRKLPLPPTVEGKGTGSFSEYLTTYTAKFKSDHQYARPDDIAYFRAKLGNHSAVIAPLPAQLTRTLSDQFDAHVKGDEAGKGWHSEMTHTATAAGNWSYTDKRWIAQTKQTYAASNVKIMGTAKAGNDGVSSFFPSTMPLALIRSEAEYVANTCHGSQQGQLIIGVGKATGIRIECLMTGTTITSAYPHLEPA